MAAGGLPDVLALAGCPPNQDLTRLVRVTPLGKAGDVSMLN